jgi:uncharacterized Fe-S center protein
MRVYLAPLHDSSSREQCLAAFERAIGAVGYLERIGRGELVAIKTHFGEAEDGNFVPPWQLAPLAAAVRQRGGVPFLVETSVLYKSPRSNAVTHLELARAHGFGELGLPIVMLDGLRGNNERAVELPEGTLCKTVNLAADLAHCDHVLVVSHVTGHLATGMGACLKNVGMGLASRKGKLQQHSGSKLVIGEKRCTACGTCIEYCPEGAIASDPGRGDKAVIDEAKCIGCGECLAVCRDDAVRFKWDAASADIQKRMAEHALGAFLLARQHMAFFDFLVDVTKDCDCIGKSDKVMGDVGILASLDPVAIDQASLDLLRARHHCRLEELTYPELDATIKLEHAERIGLGKRAHELVEV